MERGIVCAPSPRLGPGPSLGVPLVTVIVPARQERGDIGWALRSIVDQDYPAARIEVVVVDGASTDGTAEEAERVLAGAGFHRVAVLTNPVATTPSNLNRGLEWARGDIVCRVDARSAIPPDYVRRCVDVLRSRPDVAVVGGAQVATAGRDGAVAAGIARALNNRAATGLARYRRGATSGPGDTVYLGVFRTADLRRAGGWDERLPTNQDFDLNRRMGRGGAVWFEAGLDVGYRARPSLGALLRQYHRFGRWKVRYWRLTGDPPRPRQVLLLALPAVGVGILALAVLVAGVATGLAAVAAGSLAAGAWLERRSPGERGGLVARAAGVAALAAVALAWPAGVAHELVVGRRG